MAEEPSNLIPPGWKGGFAQSNSKFAYPHPDLSSLKFSGNLDNIYRLQRQQAVLWPEFSWRTVLDDEGSRAFQMFSPDISRLGYTDEGQVYSIICPQQGACHPILGCLNIEVTVTGTRGWVDEKAPKDKNVAADLKTEGQIWFTPSTCQTNPWVWAFWYWFKHNGLPFPANKANSIKVKLYNSQDTNPPNPVLAGRSGESTRFTSPDFARHPEVAWAVANLEVMIGEIEKTNSEIIDDFNQLVMDAFNVASGNLLKPKNILTWNVWLEEPALVDQEEWRKHAEKWRKSIDADHGAPTGCGTKPRYANGLPFLAVEALLEEVIEDILEFLSKHSVKLWGGLKARTS
jgi:hypothetical protein